MPETCPCKKISFLNYVIDCIKGFYIVEIEQEIFNNTYPRVLIRFVKDWFSIYSYIFVIANYTEPFFVS